MSLEVRAVMAGVPSLVFVVVCNSNVRDVEREPNPYRR